MSVRHEFEYQHKDEIKYDRIQSYNKQLCLYSTKLRYKLIIGLLIVVVIVEFVTILVAFTRSVNCHRPENETDTSGTTPTVVSMLKASEKRNITMPEPINSVCFPCAEVGINITKNDTGDIIKLDKKTNMCCMEDVGNLKKLFLLMINEYYRNAMYGVSPIQQGTEAKNPTKTEDQSEEVGVVAGHVGGSGDATKAPSITVTEYVNKSASETKSPSVAGHVGGSGGETKTSSIPAVPAFWTKREVAAHMFLDSEQLKRSNTTAPRIPWNGHDYHNLSMTSDLLVYRPDTRSIQVKQHGLYFVYSSVTLQAPQSDLNAQVYHMVLKEHYLLPNTGATIMMMNKYGGGKQSSGFYTSFLCGVFKLRVDDEIFVRVSNVSFVYQFYYSNYLGLYRLSLV